MLLHWLEDLIISIKLVFAWNSLVNEDFFVHVCSSNPTSSWISQHFASLRNKKIFHNPTLNFWNHQIIEASLKFNSIVHIAWLLKIILWITRICNLLYMLSYVAWFIRILDLALCDEKGFFIRLWWMNKLRSIFHSCFILNYLLSLITNNLPNCVVFFCFFSASLY
jgi:hypothetical protein